MKKSGGIQLYTILSVLAKIGKEGCAPLYLWVLSTKPTAIFWCAHGCKTLRLSEDHFGWQSSLYHC